MDNFLGSLLILKEMTRFGAQGRECHVSWFKLKLLLFLTITDDLKTHQTKVQRKTWVSNILKVNAAGLQGVR